MKASESKEILVCSLIALLLFSSVNVVRGPLREASAASSDSKPLHFYFHNIKNPVFVGGLATHYIMDTARSFADQAASFYKPVGQPKIAVNFYLYPELAAPVTFDGEWQVLIWVNGTALHPAGWSMRFYEKSPSGAVVWDSSALTPTVIGGPTGYSGYLDVAVFGYTLSAQLTHRFGPMNTVEVEVTVNTGSTVAATVWYDSPSHPSQAVLPSRDYAKPSSIMTYDANGTAQNTFSIFWANDQRKVIVRANVTDPFGGYDIYMANISIADQVGRNVLPNQPMKKVSGTPSSYVSVYETSWSYPRTALIGSYSIRVSVVDLNGKFQYASRGVFDPYLEDDGAAFSIGVQYRIQVQTLDSHHRPLPSAEVSASMSGIVMAGGITNSSGWWDTVLSTGVYNISVFWQHVKVGEASAKVVGPERFIIESSVYDPIFRVVDNGGNSLELAWVYVTAPNGTLSVLPFITDAHGIFSLLQAPGGNYTLQTLWKSADVGESTVNVVSDGPYDVRCKVYRVTSRVADGEGRTVQDAFVALSSAQTGIIYDLGVTNSSGQIVSRLPLGEYDVKVFWRDVLVNQSQILIDRDDLYLINAQIYVLIANVTDNAKQPLKGAYVAVSSQGRTFGFDVTKGSGPVSFTLPKGNYQLSVYYNTTYWLSSVSNFTQITIPLSSRSVVQVPLSNYPPPLWTTIGLWLIVIPVLIAIALGMTYVYRSRRVGGTRAKHTI